MKRILVGLVCLLLLAACSNEQTESTAVKPAPPVKTVEQTTQKVTETPQVVTEKTEQVAAQVVEKTEQVKAEAEKGVQQTTDKVAAMTGAMNAGKSVYEGSCKTCHGNGIMGAPKLGDDRLKGELETLVKNSLNGIGRMPAKGGVASLSDDKVRSAVEYMVEQSK